MAYTFVGPRGTTNNKVASTTVVLSVVNSSIPAGAIVMTLVSSDNLAATAGDSTDVSLTDSQSNTWTKVAEKTQTAGAAADGVTAAVFRSILTTGLTLATDFVTAAFSASVTSKAISMLEFSGTALNQHGDTQANLSAGTTPSVSFAGLSSKEYLLIGLTAIEGPSADVHTVDADYTAAGRTGTNAGGAATNVTQNPHYRIATLSADTDAPTALSVTRDFAHVLAMFAETASSTGTIPMGPLSLYYHLTGVR